MRRKSSLGSQLPKFPHCFARSRESSVATLRGNTSLSSLLLEVCEDWSSDKAFFRFLKSSLAAWDGGLVGSSWSAWLTEPVFVHRAKTLSEMVVAILIGCGAGLMEIR